MDVHLFRCQCVAAYFSELSNLLTAADRRAYWLAHYGMFHRLGIPAIMALLHPQAYDASPTYRALAKVDNCYVRARRGFFRSKHMQMGARCEAHQYWGYSCAGGWRNAADFVENLSDTDANTLQLDHSFPYSLGGVTNIENRAVLCGLHNGIKAHDIHVWQWERWQGTGSAPAWVDRALRTIAGLLR